MEGGRGAAVTSAGASSASTPRTLARGRIHACTGVLVAGGRARRLGGTPKGLLRLHGEPIVNRSVRLFRELFEDVLIVANDPAPYRDLGATIIGDLHLGKGAPGGLHAALSRVQTEWLFLAACDMPFLSREPIEALARRRQGADCVAVRWKGRLEPLHAFWSRAALDSVDRLVREGGPSMWALASTVRLNVMEEGEWAELDAEGRCFSNANTPEDVARMGLALP
jgi:molybdopterin-guanine dinucleotide biosynthesis protein A